MRRKRLKVTGILKEKDLWQKGESLQASITSFKILLLLTEK